MAFTHVLTNVVLCHDLIGWLNRVRSNARRTYQRNVWARHWFEQYFATTDPDQAFSHLNLFIECLDLRSLLWVQQIVNDRREDVPRIWREHLDLKLEARKSQRKKVEDKWKRSLYFTAIDSNISPWL
jgi:hypothetical protein